jgi:hypothetical protein
MPDRREEEVDTGAGGRGSWKKMRRVGRSGVQTYYTCKNSNIIINQLSHDETLRCTNDHQEQRLHRTIDQLMSSVFFSLLDLDVSLPAPFGRYSLLSHIHTRHY